MSAAKGSVSGAAYCSSSASALCKLTVRNRSSLFQALQWLEAVGCTKLANKLDHQFLLVATQAIALAQPSVGVFRALDKPWSKLVGDQETRTTKELGPRTLTFKAMPKLWVKAFFPPQEWWRSASKNNKHDNSILLRRCVPIRPWCSHDANEYCKLHS